MCADFVFAGEHQHCLVIMTANDKNMFDRRQFDEPSTPMTYFFHPEAGLQPVTRPGVNPDRKLSNAEHMQARRGTQSRQQACQLDVNRVQRKIQSVNSVAQQQASDVRPSSPCSTKVI